MTIKIGDIDVTAQLLENEYRISVLERVVELLMQRFPSIGAPPISPADLDAARQAVVKQMQTKYPNSGISLKGPQQ